MLGDRVGGEREAAGDLAQHHAAEALRVVLAQPRQRLDDLALGDLARVGQVGGRAAAPGDRNSSASTIRASSFTRPPSP